MTFKHCSNFQEKCFEISETCSAGKMFWNTWNVFRRKNVLKYLKRVPLKAILLIIVVPTSGNQASVYIMFYINFCYFKKSLWSSSDLLLDIPYLILTTSSQPQPQRSNIVICRPKVHRPCYVWGSHTYHCFYYITTVSITRLCLFYGNIWRACNWEK